MFKAVDCGNGITVFHYNAKTREAARGLVEKRQLLCRHAMRLLFRVLSGRSAGQFSEYCAGDQAGATGVVEIK